MSVAHAFQIISRDKQNPIPPTDPVNYTNVLDKYSKFEPELYANDAIDRQKLICKNINSRMNNYRKRLKQHNVSLNGVDVYAPILDVSLTLKSSSDWRCDVANLLRRMIPVNVTYEKDAIGTPTCERKTMELDHVIPISWIWTHRTYFEADPMRII